MPIDARYDLKKSSKMMQIPQYFRRKVIRILGTHFTQQKQPRVVVLCYHSVHPSKAFASATPELFESHLQWLKADCDVIEFRQIFDVLSCNERIRPAVAITFDDGYADNYEYAFPLLQQYDISATFFVSTGLLEQDAQVIARLQALYKTPYEDIRPLDWAQVAEMQRAGMAFGAHTHSHPNLAKLDCRAVVKELTHSKSILEHRLGAPVDLMAYPFGKPRCHYTDETVRLVSACGYAYAAAVAYRPVRASDSPFAVPRFFVTQDDLKTLREKVEGVWDVVGLLYVYAPLAVLKMIAPQDFVV